MKKYIVREVEPRACMFDCYFDDDGLTEASGDFCNTLFIIQDDGWGRINGFNLERYKEIQDKAEELVEAFDNIGNYYGYSSYKEAMEDLDIPYNSRKCHALKEWAKKADTWDTDDIAAFLSIVTGKAWSVSSVTGYSQGDYVELVYCNDSYPKGVEHYGEVWLGAAKEFCVISVDENGEESDSCYGYIIADCQAWEDTDYKRLVCEWAGIPESEAQLEMIEDSYITTHYTYRTA